MKTVLTLPVRLMMTIEPQEKTNTYKDKEGKERSRVRETLEAFLLGTGLPMTKIDININKYVANNQYRNVKITDLYKTFVKNEDDLTTGKKVIVANLEMIPQKNNFSEDGAIGSFVPYLHSYDVVDAAESDLEEIEAIKRNGGVAPEQAAG